MDFRRLAGADDCLYDNRAGHDSGTAEFSITCGTWSQVASYRESVTVVAPSGTDRSTTSSATPPQTAAQTPTAPAASTGATSSGGPTASGSGGGGALDPFWLSILGAITAAGLGAPAKTTLFAGGNEAPAPRGQCPC